VLGSTVYGDHVFCHGINGSATLRIGLQPRIVFDGKVVIKSYQKAQKGSRHKLAIVRADPRGHVTKQASYRRVVQGRAEAMP